VLFAGQVLCILTPHRLQLWLLCWMCVDVTNSAAHSLRVCIEFCTRVAQCFNSAAVDVVICKPHCAIMMLSDLVWMTVVASAVSLEVPQAPVLLQCQALRGALCKQAACFTLLTAIHREGRLDWCKTGFDGLSKHSASPCVHRQWACLLKLLGL
jgi:hypothetical protein